METFQKFFSFFFLQVLFSFSILVVLDPEKFYNNSLSLISPKFKITKNVPYLKYRKMSLKKYTYCNDDRAYEQLTPFYDNVSETGKTNVVTQFLSVFYCITSCFWKGVIDSFNWEAGSRMAKLEEFC